MSHAENDKLMELFLEEYPALAELDKALLMKIFNAWLEQRGEL